MTLEHYSAVLAEHIAILLPVSGALFGLSVVLIFGGSWRANQKLIQRQRHAIMAINARRERLERQLAQETNDFSERKREFEQALGAAQRELRIRNGALAEVRREIDAEKQKKTNEYLRLQDKVGELMRLRDEDLVSKQQLTDILAKYFRENLGAVDVTKSLQGLKKLESGGFIDAQGYERLSNIILEREFSGGPSISSQVRSVFGAIRDKL